MNKLIKEDKSEEIISSVTKLEKDSLFLSVFNNNQAIMLLVDPENHQEILEANEAALKFYGYTQKEFVQLNMGHINTSSEEKRQVMMAKAIKLSHSYFQFEHITSSGVIKTVEVNASPVVYNDRKVMFIIVHDITELKITELALKKSNEQFELAMDGSNFGIWDWWIQTDELYINERWAEILGYTLEEISPLTHETWLELSHPDDIAERDKQFNKYIKKETNIYKSDIRMKHKNGSWIWIQTQGSIFEWDEYGKPLRMSGTHLDINEKKKISLALVESENKFRSYFESSPLSLWEQDYSQLILYLKKIRVNDDTDIKEFLDSNPEIVKKCSGMLRTINVNNATLLLYESNKKEDFLVDFERIDTQMSYEVFKKKIISIYRDEILFTIKTEHFTFKGKKINIRLESIMLNSYKVLTTITDITELKNNEIELKNLLLQSKADSETKEILLKEINHRVKNNLSSFIGMLYAEKKQSGETPDMVQMEHVDSLINRVKGISIAHDMLSSSQWSPVSLSKLTEKIIHFLNYLIPKDRIIESTITPSDIFMDADQSHNTAIIVNELFSNTIKHAAGPGSITKVDINIKTVNGKIVFIYKDTGPGYPEIILKSQFENVGMYLIKNIVEQSLRGNMKISNNNGARIVIEFPGGSKVEEL